MKKQFTLQLLLFAAILTAGDSFAQLLNVQQSQRDQSSAQLNAAVSKENPNASAARLGQPANETQAMFDIQFNYAMGFASGVSCVYTGTEFWIGPWNKDSIYTMDPAGNVTAGFKITGVGAAGSGVRAFTYDGTHIYAADNTTAIKKIDPVSKTLVGTITAPSAARGLAYDSTANAGAGGFWFSNFNTSFILISMTGTTLETITVAEHGVPSCYGIAFDPYTAGGPYIWAFNQGTNNPNDSAKLHRIHIPTHTHTGLVHNVNADVAQPGAIAGSVSITWRYDAMNYTLMGCTQDGTNNLFGYELADYTPPAIDGYCSSIDFYPPYLQIPGFEVTPMIWDVHVGNNGSSTINDLETSFIMDDGAVAVYSPPPFHNLSMSPGSTGLANFGLYTPPPPAQMYNITASTSPVGQTDQDLTNDMNTYSMFVTDTVMARDNGNPTGSLGMPGATAGVLGQVFEIPYTCLATSATFQLRNPDVGDTVNVDLYTYVSLPDQVIASTGVYVVQPADTDGVVVTLPFDAGPVNLTPGVYFLGVNQYVTDSNITLGTSSFNWRPDAAYFQFAGGSWQTVESNTNPFFICYLLRLNMFDPGTKIAEVNDQKFQIYPNPAASAVYIRPLQSGSPYEVELYDLIGNKVMHQTNSFTGETVLDVSSLAKGMYLVKTISGGNAATTKVTIN